MKLPSRLHLYVIELLSDPSFNIEKDELPKIITDYLRYGTIFNLVLVVAITLATASMAYCWMYGIGSAWLAPLATVIGAFNMLVVTRTLLFICLAPKAWLLRQIDYDGSIDIT